MKISTILTALIFLFIVSCSSGESKNEHGHEHNDTENGHQHEEKEENHVIEQEEFIVKEDSTQVKSKLDDHGHSHDKKHNHNH